MHPRPERLTLSSTTIAPVVEPLMQMKDKLNISIRIADQPSFSLRDVTPGEEQAMREAEYNINQLWTRWCKLFKGKTPTEVLARVAFQYARLYYEQLRDIDDLDKTLSRFESDLDEIVVSDGGANMSADAEALPSAQS